MPRWEGDAQGRLERAALELFGEHGFDRTTVAQIARRAGLNERSFYRYFSDKREVLFGGAAELQDRLEQALRDTPAGVAPLDALLAALEDASAVFRPRELLRIRGRVINANPELRERELGKMDALDAALVAGLRERGEDETTARFATDLAVSIWRVAARRCLRNEDSAFADELQHAARQMRRIAAGGRAAAEPATEAISEATTEAATGAATGPARPRA